MMKFIKDPELLEINGGSLCIIYFNCEGLDWCLGCDTDYGC